jgi:putative endonuclease
VTGAGYHARESDAKAGIQGPVRHRLDTCVRRPCVYILASKRNGTLYIGVTSDLSQRIWQHRNDAVEGFTKRYGIHFLVHGEFFETMYDAVRRENQMKKMAPSQEDRADRG